MIRRDAARAGRILLLAIAVALAPLRVATADPPPGVLPPPAGAGRDATVGLRIEKALNRRDSAALQALVDPGAMIDHALADLTLPSLQSTAIREGAMGGLGQLSRNAITLIARQGGVARLMKSLPGEAHDRHLVRIVFHDEDGTVSGLEYLDFLTGDNGLVHDWFSHAQGEWMSGRARTLLITMTAEPGNHPQLFGSRSFDTEALSTLVTFAGQYHSGNTAAAHRTLDALPDTFRATRTWASLRATVASDLDPETYQASLQHLGDRFGKADDLQFQLFDLHVLNGEPDKALAALRRFERSTIEDGHTNRLKCLIAADAGDLEAATGHCRRSIQLEPQVEDAWWALAGLGNLGNDAGLVLDALDGLEWHFGMDFDPSELLRIDDYGWLKGSPEFKRWAAPRRIRHARW
ncbi:MAG: hypothetical protein KF823_06655 [Xanthomonadales bacterium]|nr:hypothetical protein [Xanthomonadales bacterium]